ncbi:meprin A subunit beta-like [Periplaneta americana]|uniref:meprin A subunit beta-like n=1 Tax=Periplaneta americana TaxID=6978 RepID=UPI0037E8AC8D
MRAMDHYHQHSCIRFKEWTGEANYVTVFFNPESGACWSPVGRVGGGEQRLSLGQRCWYLGIVIHELGHAVGFWHEMNRPDRDTWIYVYWKNIIPGFTSAFAKHDPSTVDTLGENFDYKSIMMYDEYAFSKDGVSPTLQATQNGVVIGPIWKKPGLSASDIRRIHKLYKCPDDQPKPGFPYDEVCTFNTHTCGFKNGGAAVWNWRALNSSDGYVYASYEQAGATPGYFLSVNFHALAEHDPRGSLGCVRFWYLLQADCDLRLALSQAFLNAPTQLFYDPDAAFEVWENSTSTGHWMHVQVPIYVTRPFKLMFQSFFNQSCSFGNIALDDVEMLYMPCEGVTTASPTTTSPTIFSTSTECVTDEPVPVTTMAPLPTTPLLPVTIFPTDFMKPPMHG